MSENAIRDAIQDAITEHEVILFMKGTPEQPMCGFSARTVAALDAVGREFAAVDTAGLRVGVRGGGCSGFQYALAFDVQRDDDTVFEDHGIKLLVDQQSLAYVTGAVVDYVDGLQGAGFQVNNPNVIASCGCGSSFRVRDEEEVSAV